MISIKTKSINEEISNLQADLRKLNKEIIRLEDKSTEKYKKEICNALQSIIQKYRNHYKQKPTEIKKPEDIENSDKTNLIFLLNKDLSCIKSKIEDETEKLVKININLQKISDFRVRINNLIETADILNSEFNDLAEKFGLSSKLFIDVKINDDELINLERQSNEQKNNINNLIKENINEEKNSSIPNFANMKYEDIKNEINKISNLNDKMIFINSTIKKISEQVSNKQQEYFQYQRKYEEWEQYRKMLLGNI